MKQNSKFSRALMVFAIILGWKTHAEMRELSHESLQQTQLPTDAVGKLVDNQIILAGPNGLCFDYGQAFEKANGDKELQSYVEMLRQMTTGSSVVTECRPAMMQAGVQVIAGVFMK